MELGPGVEDAGLEVNARLRHRGLLPVSVTLQSRLENGPHMRADHKFIWELDGNNKKTILHWEKMSTARDVKQVGPDEFFEQPIKQARNRR